MFDEAVKGATVSSFLKFLTDDDRKMLLGDASLESFEPDSIIVAEGEPQKAIFVLASGEARVEKAHGDFGIEVSRLGPGDIFGEMGFIDGFEASASVIADGPCTVHVISNDLVNEKIKSDPGFYGRFYQSLAHTLSGRLRDTTLDTIADYSWGTRVLEQKPESAVEDAAEWGGGSPFGDDSKR